MEEKEKLTNYFVEKCISYRIETNEGALSIFSAFPLDERTISDSEDVDLEDLDTLPFLTFLISHVSLQRIYVLTLADRTRQPLPLRPQSRYKPNLNAARCAAAFNVARTFAHGVFFATTNLIELHHTPAFRTLYKLSRLVPELY